MIFMLVCACILILSYLYTRILEGSQPSIVQTDGDERLDFSWQAFDRHSNMVLGERLVLSSRLWRATGECKGVLFPVLLVTVCHSFG